MKPPLDDSRRRVLADLAAKIGHEFRRLEWLNEALVHPSMGNVRSDNYERLEFLGDAILGLVVSEHLFHEHAELPEGELTRLRTHYVSQAPLAVVAQSLDLVGFVEAGRGMSIADLRSERILANLVESVLAAVYLDGGMRAARRFVKRHLIAPMPIDASLRRPRDSKSRLLHRTQANGSGQPLYRVRGSTGPDHDRTFEVEVLVAERLLGAGTGRSKREAEQAAASAALERLRIDAEAASDDDRADDA